MTLHIGIHLYQYDTAVVEQWYYSQPKSYSSMTELEHFTDIRGLEVRAKRHILSCQLSRYSYGIFNT